MVSGAAEADAAVLVIDAQEGLQDQTRRHAYLVSLLGLGQIAVAVNKIDLVDFAEARFRAVEKEIAAFLAQFGLTPKVVAAALGAPWRQSSRGPAPSSPGIGDRR